HVALIFVWQETGGELVVDQPRARAEQNQNRQSKGALADQSSAHPHVRVRSLRKKPVESVEELLKQPVAWLTGPQRQSSKRRAQAQSVEGRENHGDCNRHCELLV